MPDVRIHGSESTRQGHRLSDAQRPLVFHLSPDAPGKARHPPAAFDLPLPMPKARRDTRDDPVASVPMPTEVVRIHGWPPRPGPRVGDRSQRAALALAGAAKKLAQAEAAGVAVPRLSFIRRLQQVAQVPLATFDLLLACVATVATLGLIGPAVQMAAGKLRQAVKAVGAPAPQAVVVHVAEPISPPVPDGAPLQKAAAALQDARTNLEKARQQTGIDFARRSFISRAIGVGVGLVGLGLAIAATVASGGIAAPALVLTVILLRQTVANAHCAWRHLQLLSSGQPGLPMGASALGNALYEYQMTRPDVKPEQARLSATRSVAATTAATVGAILAVGAVFVLAVPLVEKCLRVFCSVAQRAVLPPADFAMSETLKSRMAQARRDADARVAQTLRELLDARDALRIALHDAAKTGERVAELEAFDALVARMRCWPSDDPSLATMFQQVEQLGAASPGLAPSPRPSGEDRFLAQSRTYEADTLGRVAFTTSTLTLATSLLVSLAG